MRLAVVIGHTRRSPGAWSPYLALSEYDFNSDLAQRLKAAGGPSVGIFRRDGHGVPGAYREAQLWCATAIVELHFNASSNPTSQGTETLWRTPGSERLARALQTVMLRALALRDRGAKWPWQGRGEASLTALPDTPSVLVEPFFGSNAADCARVGERKQALAEAILEGVQSFHAAIHV